MTDQLQVKKNDALQTVKNTALRLAKLYGANMTDDECVEFLASMDTVLGELAKGVEKCEPVCPPAKPTMRVRAAGVAYDTGRWCVYGASGENRDGSHTQLCDDELIGDVLDGSEGVLQISFIEIDLPVPQTETIQAALVEEVAL